MALPFAVTLTLIIIYISFFIKKRFSFLHNAIVFMAMTIITKNYVTNMTMELKLISATEDPFLFLYLLIDREIIIPLIIIIYLNLNEYIEGTIAKVFLFLTILGFLQVLDGLENYFHVTEFVKWNMFYALVVNLGYILIGLGISKVLLVISEWKGQKYDSYL